MSELGIFEGEHWRAVQASDYRLPGYLIVESKHEVRELDALSEQATRELWTSLARAERIVRALVAPERVYTLRFGELVPRLHFHVIPRTARVGSAFALACGQRAPFNGARLVDWLWDHHQELGSTDEELRAFVEAARAYALEGA